MRKFENFIEWIESLPHKKSDQFHVLIAIYRWNKNILWWLCILSSCYWFLLLLFSRWFLWYSSLLEFLFPFRMHKTDISFWNLNNSSIIEGPSVSFPFITSQPSDGMAFVVVCQNSTHFIYICDFNSGRFVCAFCIFFTIVFLNFEPNDVCK